MEIYVARHGRVPSNDNKIISGRSDEELTEIGISQAEEVRDKIKELGIDVIFSSPVKRAVQTANIINVENKEIIFDERLSEREPGKMLGKSRKEIDIDSEDIMEILNSKPGKYLKDIISDVEREILYRRLENKKESIVEYILKNYEGIDFDEECK